MGLNRLGMGKHISKLLLAFFCGIAVLYCGCAKLGGIKTLMKLGASDKLKEQASAQETENFQRVKAYIEERTIKTGITQDEAVRIFGGPVIVVDQGDREKWAYKPAESKWFGGEKIYLFFNKEEKLISWEYIDRQYK